MINQYEEKVPTVPALDTLEISIPEKLLDDFIPTVLVLFFFSQM